MGIDATDEIQPIQTAYRQRLVAHWQIQPGMKILEVGCGQGDMTAALAAAVGATGLVDAYDIASPDYGAPLTLGQAQARLAAGPLGAQVQAHLATDVTQCTFAPRQFDALVITHAAWYFPDAAAFIALLTALAPAVDRILIAEWSLVLSDAQQAGHLLAALIQSEYAVKHPDPQANIRTLITPAQLRPALEALGFTVTAATVATTVATTDMQDGGWEIGMTLYDTAAKIAADQTLGAAERLRYDALLATLTASKAQHKALDAFALDATRR